MAGAAAIDARITALYYVTTMNERVVGAREANQQFSTLLAATERDGITVVITRRGRIVARLVPESAQPATERCGPTMMDALFDRYSRPMGGEAFVREELYDRGKVGS